MRGKAAATLHHRRCSPRSAHCDRRESSPQKRTVIPADGRNPRVALPARDLSNAIHDRDNVNVGNSGSGFRRADYFHCGSRSISSRMLKPVIPRLTNVRSRLVCPLDDLRIGVYS
ncbi:hypothetical protein HN011_002711 [Eciton burchellii]|nr:hypothetical protein HN011_002711 [Eciton burchellii]